MVTLFALNVLELNDACWPAALWAGGEVDAHCKASFFAGRLGPRFLPAEKSM